MASSRRITLLLLVILLALVAIVTAKSNLASVQKDIILDDYHLTEAKLDKLLTSWSHNLASSHQLSKKNAQLAADDLRRNLEDYTKKGVVTHKDFEKALDKSRKNAIKQKWFTDATWDDAALDYFNVLREDVNLTRDNHESLLAKIDYSLTSLKNYLLHGGEVTAKNSEYLTDEIRRTLTDASKDGEIKRAEFAKSFDKVKKEALKKKWVTESQWDELLTNVQTSYYDNYKHGKQNAFAIKRSASDAISNVKAELSKQAGWTEANVNWFIADLQKRIEHVSNAATEKKDDDDAWLESLKNDLKARKGLTQDQIESALGIVSSHYHTHRNFISSLASDFATSVQSFLDRVRTNLSEISELTTDTVESIVGDLAIKLGLRKQKNWSEVKADQVRDALKDLQDNLVGTHKVKKNRAESIVSSIQSTFDEYYNSISASASSIISVASQTLSSASSVASKSASSAASVASESLSSAASIASKSVSSKASSVSVAASKSLSSASKEAKASVSSISKSASSAASAATNTKSQSSIKSKASSSASSLSSKISKSASSVSAQATKEPIASQVSRVVSSAASAASSVVSSAASAASSKVFKGEL